MSPVRQSLWNAETVFYQLFAGRWQGASLLEEKGQVFANLAKTDLAELKKLGVSWVYLLGVFENEGPIVVGEEGGHDLASMENRLPSVFAISNHKATSPLLGSKEEFRELVDKWHQQEMRVMVDFVPNHTGTGHAWTSNHPEYYVKGEGGLVAEFSGDVYKLDYGNSELRREMVEVLEEIASWGVDGVRCDMAHLVPNSFWREATKKVREKRAEFVFIAEAYPESAFDLSVYDGLLENGFDSVYDGPFYNNLKAVVGHNQGAAGLVEHVRFMMGKYEPSQVARYVANHDDPLVGDLSCLQAVLALALSLAGPVLVFNGLLKGRGGRLAHHYYQELGNENQETNGVGQELAKLFEVRKKYGLVASEISEVNGLVRVGLSGDAEVKKGELVINFGDGEVEVKTEMAPGVWRGLRNGDKLGCYQVELFVEK